MENKKYHTYGEILANIDLREEYDMAVEVKQALMANGATVPDVESELSRLKSNPTSHREFRWHKVAAIFIGLLVVCSLCIASVMGIRRTLAGQDKKTASKTEVRTVENASENSSEILFENASLESIMNSVSERYRVKVVYENETTKGIRLYYSLDCSLSLEEVINQLRHFEELDITLNRGVIFVR